MTDYSVVIPTLNEADNLRVLLPKVVKPNCEVWVCDNGSIDGTPEIAESLGAKVSRGSGTVVDALLRGFKRVTSSKTIIMDADGSHDPRIIPEMVASLDTHDVVVGRRSFSYDSFKNRMISKVYNLLVLGLAPGIEDRVSGFWGIRTPLLDTPIRNTKKPLLEYLVRSPHNGVVEVPYIFQKRLSGSSKLGRSLSTVISELYSTVLLYFQKYRILNYMFVGGVGFILNLGIYYPLTLLFKSKVVFLGQVFYLPPYVISVFFSGSLNYFVNKKWTFSDRKESKLGFFRFWAMSIPTLMIDLTLLFLIVQFLHLQPIVAAGIAILIVFIARYSIVNKWIWGSKK